jgi:hypothetical protein
MLRDRVIGSRVGWGRRLARVIGKDRKQASKDEDADQFLL